MITEFSRIGHVRVLDLPRHSQTDGELVVATSGECVPFPIARLFTIKAPLGAERGKHAHRRCSQFMICVHGALEIICDDSSERRTFVLDRGNLALVVPPTIWCTVVYRQAASVLAVLCDRPYEADDYIRDYAQFLAFRKAKNL
jgi:hypothetical protein